MSAASHSSLLGADRREERRRSNITSACDRCRLKKKGCGGEKPTCSSCTSAGAECVYSNAVKQRGPIAGRVRELEVRVMWLQAYIVVSSEQHHAEGNMQDCLAVLEGWERQDWEALPDTFDTRFGPLLDSIQAYHDEKGDEVVHTGKRKRNENSAAPLTGTTEQSAAPFERPTARLVALETSPGFRDTASRRQASVPAGSVSNPVAAPMSVLPASRLSLNAMATDAGSSAINNNASSDLANDIATSAPDTWAYLFSIMNENPVGSPSTGRPQPVVEESSQSVPWQDFEDLFRMETNPAMASSAPVAPAHVDTQAQYPATPSSAVPLPPEDVQRRLIAIYLDEPDDFLPIVKRSDLIVYAGGQLTGTPPSKLLLFALFAYCACLSPTAGGAAPNIDALGGNDQPGGSLSELWIAEARTMATGLVARGQVDVDTIQAICFLVMREMGKTQYDSAWLWLGICIRAAQLLDLDISVTHDNLWSSLAFLDSVLAVALGTPPSVGSQQMGGSSARSNNTAILQASRLSTQWSDSRNSHTAEANDLATNSHGALSTWTRSLPMSLQFRLGEDLPMDVAVLHLFYGIFNVLLVCVRPRDALQQNVKPYIAAATGLRLMLETTLHQSGSSIPLLRRCPYLIYGIYAASVHLRAIALWLGPDNTMAKPLVDCYTVCRDTLQSMAETWPLGAFCAARLDLLSEQSQVDEKTDVMILRADRGVAGINVSAADQPQMSWAPGRDPFAVLNTG